MARRRKISLKKRVRKNHPNGKNRAPSKLMLDMRNSRSFKYRLKNILEDMDGNEPIFANINSKSINIGTMNAKEYIEDVVKEGNLKREKADEIIDLLDRFSKYR